MKLKISIIILLLSACAFQLSAQVDSLSIKRADSLRIDSLINKDYNIDEIVVVGKSNSTELVESPVSVEVLELEPILNKSGNMIDVVTRIPGIHARTDGSVGDPVNFVIHGLQRKQIVLFKDDIPMSFYGHSFEPGHVSSNMFERVEVYKGVLPLRLGADALGGGVNFITRKPDVSEVNLSAEYGSFNTQRLTFNGFHPFTKSKDFYVGANASYVDSDNDYPIRIPRDISALDGTYPDNLDKITRLKNNEATIYSGEYYIGVRDKKWADDFRIIGINSLYKRELNHIPYQGLYTAANALFAHGKDETQTIASTYKGSFFNDRLSLNLMGGYGKTKARFIDSVQTTIDEAGNLLDISLNNPNQRRGELFGANLDLEYTLRALRVNGGFEFIDNHTIEINHMYTDLERVGTDPIGGLIYSLRPEDFGELVDAFKFPASHKKSVSAIGLNSNFFNDKLETIAAYKHYKRYGEGYATYAYLGQPKILGKGEENDGWLLGASYRLNDRFLFKSSYENTVRMPDNEELFGNSIWVKSNFNVSSESSKNFNFQFQYSSKKEDIGAFLLNGSVFNRKTTDYIYISMEDIDFAKYKNFDDIGLRVKGFDVAMNYKPFKRLTIGGNGTLMYRRLGKNDLTVDELMWDISPIQGNANASYQWENGFQKNSTTELYWYYNYMHRYRATNNFDVGDESLGLFDKPNPENQNQYGNYAGWVPYDGRLGQQYHTAGVSVNLAKPKLSITAECKNLTDEEIYTHISPGPPRSFSLKALWRFNP